MKSVKSFCVKTITILLLLVALSTVFTAAAYALNVSVWYADIDGGADAVMYQPSSQRYYSCLALTTNITVNQTIIDYIYDAAAAWRTELGITLTASSSSANSRNAYVVYYGTEEDIKEFYNGFHDGDPGYTHMSDTENVGTVTYQGTGKNVYEFRETVSIYINTDYDSDYWEVAVAHETGHALGWYGHNGSRRSMLMYDEPASSITSPTSRDIAHLSQIYDNREEWE